MVKAFSCLFVAFTMFMSAASARSYTAVQSGKWSNPATWGGEVPEGDDDQQITIPAGIEVLRDYPVHLDSPDDTLTVNGKLSGYYIDEIYIYDGVLSGTGEITSSGLNWNFGGIFSFSGKIDVFKFRCSANPADSNGCQFAAQLVVRQELSISNTVLWLNAGSNITLTNTPTIVLRSGGRIVTNGGTIDLSKPYRVQYGGQVFQGIELLGAGLISVQLYYATLTLESDLKTSLVLSYGSIKLNGHDLTLTGFSASGYNNYIYSNSTSDITVNCPANLTFSSTDNAVRNFIVNPGIDKTVSVNNDFTVVDTLNLVSGVCKLGKYTYTLNGALVGEGAFSGDTNTNLIINCRDGTPDGLRFAPSGGFLGSLILNPNPGIDTRLVSDLAVTTLTALNSGNLIAHNVSLSLRGSLKGAGKIVVNDGTTLTMGTRDTYPHVLPIIGTTIGGLVLDLQTDSAIALDGDLRIMRSLALLSGSLWLDGHDLIISGDNVSDSGRIHSTSLSNITINGNGSSSGALSFLSDGHDVGIFTIDVADTSQVSITDSINVTNALHLNSGVLLCKGAAILSLNHVYATNGTLQGDWLTTLILNSQIGAELVLKDIENLGTLIVNVPRFYSVKAWNRLSLQNLELLTGSLDVKDASFTIYGSLSGGGWLATNENTELVIKTKAGLSLPLPLHGTRIRVLRIDIDSTSTVLLGTDISVLRALELESGSLVLNGFDLITYANIQYGGSGVVSSTDKSNVIITGAEGWHRTLRFHSVNNTINNLTIDLGNKNTVNINTKFTVNGMLRLFSGMIALTDTMTIGRSGSILQGADSSYIRPYIGALAMYLEPGVPMKYPVGHLFTHLPTILKLHPESEARYGFVSVLSDFLYFSDSTYVFRGTERTHKLKTTPTVHSTWDIGFDTTSNLKYDLELVWNVGEEVNGFDRTQAYIGRFRGKSYDIGPISPAAKVSDSTYSLSRTGIDTSGRFAILDLKSVDVVEDNGEENLHLYPSPVEGVLHVDHGGTGDPYHIEVIDTHGRVVITTTATAPTTSISVSSLSSGVYFVRLHNSHSTTTKRFVKL